MDISDLERKQDAVQLECTLADPANTNAEQNQVLSFLPFLIYS